MKKVIYTLNIDNHNKEITKLTFPFLIKYAEKIGAEFQIISQRKFPDFPITYEKLQIYELGKNNDWNIYIDSDALIHPDSPDWTSHINKDTVLYHGVDMASIRWKYDKPFFKDGRNIGTCSWFVVSSDLTHNLWHPLEDLSVEEALKNIYPINREIKTVVDKEHLFDDYVISRNVAIYSLKIKTILYELLNELNIPDCKFFHHEYLYTPEQKLKLIKDIIREWDL